MFGTALIPINLSESQARLDALFRWVHRLGVSRARVLHVASTAAAGRRGTDRIEAICKRYRSESCSVAAEIRTGSTVPEIIAATVADETDLIVFPWKRQSLLKRSLMGNVMRDLARQTDLPLLVVRSGGAGGSGGRLKPNPEDDGPEDDGPEKDGPDDRRHRDEAPKSPAVEPAGLFVLFATDLGESDEQIASVFTGGSVSLAGLQLVYAGERAPDPQAEQRRATRVQEALDRLAARIGTNLPQSQPVPVETETLVGPARTRLPRYIRRVEPDLVVIGKGGSVHGIGGIMGSVSEEVAYRAPVSVLIVPGAPGGGS